MNASSSLHAASGTSTESSPLCFDSMLFPRGAIVNAFLELRMARRATVRRPGTRLPPADEDRESSLEAYPVRSLQPCLRFGRESGLNEKINTEGWMRGRIALRNALQARQTLTWNQCRSSVLTENCLPDGSKQDYGCCIWQSPRRRHHGWNRQKLAARPNSWVWSALSTRCWGGSVDRAACGRYSRS